MQLARKAPTCVQVGAFLLYSPAASSLLFVRDIAFGSGMRFARWKLQGEYNITAERSGAISLLRKQKYHADEVIISLNSLQLTTFMLSYFRGDDNGKKTNRDKH